MSSVALVVSAAVALVALVTAVAGAALWWRLVASDRFWIAIRTTQAGALVLALLAAATWLAGGHPDNWLYWLYALLPIAVSFVAEQLRIAAAEQVLERRGLQGAADVGRLDDVGQRSVVREIVRRETGVMTAAAFVIAILAIRVLGERGGL